MIKIWRTEIGRDGPKVAAIFWSSRTMLSLRAHFSITSNVLLITSTILLVISIRVILNLANGYLMALDYYLIHT